MGRAARLVPMSYARSSRQTYLSAGPVAGSEFREQQEVAISDQERWVDCPVWLYLIGYTTRR